MRGLDSLASASLVVVAVPRYFGQMAMINILLIIMKYYHDDYHSDYNDDDHQFAIRDFYHTLPAHLLAGKILVDVSNRLISL